MTDPRTERERAVFKFGETLCEIVGAARKLIMHGPSITAIQNAQDSADQFLETLSAEIEAVQRGG